MEKALTTQTGALFRDSLFMLPLTIANHFLMVPCPGDNWLQNLPGPKPPPGANRCLERSMRSQGVLKNIAAAVGSELFFDLVWTKGRDRLCLSEALSDWCLNKTMKNK